MALNHCYELKSISEPEACRLQDLEEARGQLLSVFCRDGFAVASFEWGAVAFPEEMYTHLEGLVGKTVAIFRLDGRFHVRDLEGENHVSR
jgi:hypothetical protein